MVCFEQKAYLVTKGKQNHRHQKPAHAFETIKNSISARSQQNQSPKLTFRNCLRINIARWIQLPADGEGRYAIEELESLVATVASLEGRRQATDALLGIVRRRRSRSGERCKEGVEEKLHDDMRI